MDRRSIGSHRAGANGGRWFVECSLLLVGLLVIGCGAAWQLQLLPGSEVALPEPLAFHGTPGLRDIRAPPPQPTPTTRATGAPQSLQTAQPATAQPAEEALPLPGIAQRLVIASIDLDTPVVDGGLRQGAGGVVEWETVPFVAVHYSALTALVGARGNAVIAGHVATREQGNVFIDLYRVELGDEVRVWDERGNEHIFGVSSVQLVVPSDTSVMNETTDSTLTLMTCGGTFDPVRREFSDRLVVSAKLL